MWRGLRSYEGRTIDTPFLISAVGDEFVVEELSPDERGVRARVPIAEPAANPELHDIIVNIIIANVNRQST